MPQNKIVKFPYTSGHFKDVDFDDHNVQSFIIKTLYFGFIANFSKNFKINMIVIHTDYTERLIEDPEKMKSISDDPHIIYILGNKKKNILDYIRPSEKKNKKLLNEIASYGDVVFKIDNHKDLFNCIKVLNKYNYCEHCNELNMYLVEWRPLPKPSNKYYIYIKIDTESG